MLHYSVFCLCNGYIKQSENWLFCMPKARHCIFQKHRREICCPKPVLDKTDLFIPHSLAQTGSCIINTILRVCLCVSLQHQACACAFAQIHRGYCDTLPVSFDPRDVTLWLGTVAASTVQNRKRRNTTSEEETGYIFVLS